MFGSAFLRRIIALLFALNAVLGCSAAVAEQDVADFKWTEEYKKGISITKYLGESKEVVVPAYINGKAVTKIGFRAFCDQDITSIVIPDTVKEIEYQAFENCHSLESISLPKGLETIRNLAFWNCESLEHIVIPAGIKTIEEEPFSGCDNLKFEISGKNSRFYIQDDMLIDKKEKTVLAYMGDASHVTIPEGIIRIGRDVFLNCEEIEEISLPKSLLGVGDEAFRNCINLCRVTLPEKLNIIEGAAFYNCQNLESINIPDNIKIIELNVFNYCPKLNIEISENHKGFYVHDNMLIEKPYRYTNALTYGTAHGSWSEDLSSDDYSLISIWGDHDSDFVVPEDVTAVYALSGIAGLKSITFHERVGYIGDIFKNCPELKKVTILGKDTIFSRFAFREHKGIVLCVYPKSEACKIAKEEGISYTFVGPL